MSQLNIVGIPVDKGQFGVSAKQKLLIAEHSDLGNPNLFNRIYDDACDVGISLYNGKTNKKTTWYFLKEDKWCDEVVAWVFRPIHEDVYRNPALKGWEVRILND
jgi:hypothetical protein